MHTIGSDILPFLSAAVSCASYLVGLARVDCVAISEGMLAAIVYYGLPSPNSARGSLMTQAL